MNAAQALAVLLLCAGLAGCVYSHTTRPLTTDLHGATIVDATSSGDVKQFDYYLRVVWDSNGIGQIAAENGFEEVYYADLETLRILGIWTQQWVHVYGKRARPEPDDGSS